MGRQRRAESGIGRLWGLSKIARGTARKRRISSQRHSSIERLVPRVVLNGAPVAVADPWYSTAVSTTLNVTTQGTTLVAMTGIRKARRSCGGPALTDASTESPSRLLVFLTASCGRAAGGRLLPSGDYDQTVIVTV